MVSHAQRSQNQTLQAAPRTGRTHWWSRLPGLSAVPGSTKTKADAAVPPNSPPRSQPLADASSAGILQHAEAFCVPTITIKPSETFLSAASALPEAAGIIDPTLLHAPFLREPLFVPSPGSGRKALKKWVPEGYGSNESSFPRYQEAGQGCSDQTESQPAIKYWLHYAEPELYMEIEPGQALRLCDDAQSGHRYTVCGTVGSVGQGVAFWASPVEEENLPLAVVLFLPPGTHCPPYVLAILQVMTRDALGHKGQNLTASLAREL